MKRKYYRRESGGLGKFGVDTDDDDYSSSPSPWSEGDLAEFEDKYESWASGNTAYEGMSKVGEDVVAEWRKEYGDANVGID